MQPSEVFVQITLLTRDIHVHSFDILANNCNSCGISLITFTGCMLVSIFSIVLCTVSAYLDSTACSVAFTLFLVATFSDDGDEEEWVLLTPSHCPKS
jgi:hypothetical protein